MTPQDAALALILMVSGFTMTFAGFGFALISVPLLALLLPVKEAVALQFPYCALLFFYQAWRYRRSFRWQRLSPLFWGAALGMGLGVFLLYQLPALILKRALALFIVSVVIFNALPAGKRFVARHAGNPWWGGFCGLLSGSFFGAYTIGGPPAAVYIMSITASPREAKSLLASFFSLQFVLLALVYGAAGMFTWPLLKTTLIFSPAAAAGAAVGFWAFARASNRLYLRVVAGLLLLAALLLWRRF